jgi:hypothetical protein
MGGVSPARPKPRPCDMKRREKAHTRLQSAWQNKSDLAAQLHLI